MTDESTMIFSPCASVGTTPFSFSLRYQSARFSFLPESSRRSSNGSDFSASTMRTFWLQVEVGQL